MHCAYRSLRRRIASHFLNVAPLPACQRRVSPARQTASFANGARRGMTSSASPPPTVVSFLTDVEGDGVYFDRFVRQSKVLEFRAIAPRFGRYPVRGPATGPSGTAWNLGEWDEDYFPYDKEVVFANGARGGSVLVFGGDIWDKGGADLYVLRQLLSLRRRAGPDRVHFLMGNRDINKMRIVDECGVGNIRDQDEALPLHEGVYWRAGLEHSIPPDESAAERVKWMLGKTMGSVDAFELRRNELERERAAVADGTAVSSARRTGMPSTGVSVTDAEVAQSYIRSCDPANGIMGQYLMHAKLMIRLGERALFMHGAFPMEPDSDGVDHCLNFPTPWRHESGSEDSLTNWIKALDEFSSGRVEAWKNYRGQCPGELNSVWATEGGYFNDSPAGRAFGALMQYGMGTLASKSSTQSCVYSSWMHDGAPREMFTKDESRKTFAELLMREGVEVVLTGHQPVGDAPCPIQVSQEGAERRLWILQCDTSFSGDTRWTRPEGCNSSEKVNLGRGSAASGRGEVAVSEPLIQLCQATQAVESLTIHGCLSDGSYYETNNITNACDGENAPIGRPLVGKDVFKDNGSGDTLENKLWVKGKLGDKYLVSYGKGFNVWNACVKLQSNADSCVLKTCETQLSSRIKAATN